MLRWSAVFAGGACSVGIWLVLELLGVGAGLYAHHTADSAGGMHAASVATRVWSLVAQKVVVKSCQFTPFRVTSELVKGETGASLICRFTVLGSL